MAIVMNMSSYVIEDVSVNDRECTDKVLHAGWYPQLELATQQHLLTLKDKHPALPASLLTADADMFLQKMHAYQC